MFSGEAKTSGSDDGSDDEVSQSSSDAEASAEWRGKGRSGEIDEGVKKERRIHSLAESFEVGEEVGELLVGEDAGEGGHGGFEALGHNGGWLEDGLPEKCFVGTRGDSFEGGADQFCAVEGVATSAGIGGEESFAGF